MDTWLVPLTLSLALAVFGLGIWLFLKWQKDLARREWDETPSSPLPGTASERASLEELIPDSYFVKVEGLKIHYVQAGHGPDVVLLHGIGASIFIWRFLFPLLQKNHRVTAIDLPGFGQSSKDSKHDYGLDSQTAVLIAALDGIGIKNANLAGSSMGGAIALWMAKRDPRRFSHVATFAPATDGTLLSPHIRHLANATPLLRRALNRRTMRLILDRVFVRKDLITDAVIDRYLEPFLDEGHGVRSFWLAIKLLSDRRLPRDLEGMQAKVLIAWGEKDLMVSRRSIERLRRVLPTAKFVTNPIAGHHPMEDEPEWTANVLSNFFRA